jgi:hypothetical protein
MSLKAVSKHILALEHGARLGRYPGAQGPRAGGGRIFWVRRHDEYVR